jgi:hypothetical protein
MQSYLLKAATRHAEFAASLLPSAAGASWSRKPAAAQTPTEPTRQQHATKAAAGTAGGAPCARLRLRDVLLGFSDARVEAAFQLAKARRLEQADRWTERMVVMMAVMGVLAACQVALLPGVQHAQLFAVCSVSWWAWALLPAAARCAARPLYLPHRGWLWGVAQLLSGCHSVVMAEIVLAGGVAELNAVFLGRRRSPFAVLEFVVRPALLRLSAPQQLLASVGSAINTYYVSHGPADGPYTPAACLAMGGGAVALAALMDARARRAWLVKVQ